MNLSIQVERLEITNLEPDDISIVTLPATADPEQLDYVKERFKADFPDHRTLVKTNNIGIDIFRGGVDGESREARA